MDLQLNEMAEKASGDEDYQGIINLFREGKNIDNLMNYSRLENYKRILNELSIIEMPEGGLLVYEDNRVYIPVNQRQNMIKELHKFYFTASSMTLTAK